MDQYSGDFMVQKYLYMVFSNKSEKAILFLLIIIRPNLAILNFGKSTIYKIQHKCTGIRSKNYKILLLLQLLSQYPQVLCSLRLGGQCDNYTERDRWHEGPTYGQEDFRHAWQRLFRPDFSFQYRYFCIWTWRLQ